MLQASQPQERTVACACGKTRLHLRGRPIVTLACYCADCRNGSAQLEALPAAPRLLDPHGGTEYVLYRKDRFGTEAGSELLRHVKLREPSKTSRVVAACCNSALFMHFADGRHWVPVYRQRFGGDAPPLEMRIAAGSATGRLPADVKRAAGIPLKMVVKLLRSMLPAGLDR
jgi:hypothetical protein